MAWFHLKSRPGRSAACQRRPVSPHLGLRMDVVLPLGLCLGWFLRRSLDILRERLLLLLVPEILQVIENGARQGMRPCNLLHDHKAVPLDQCRWQIEFRPDRWLYLLALLQHLLVLLKHDPLGKLHGQVKSNHPTMTTLLIDSLAKRLEPK